MKKVIRLLPVLASLFAITAGILFSSINNNKVNEVKAEEYTSNGYFCLQVTDISQIHDGDTVFLGHYNTLLSSIGGNPVYPYGVDVPSKNYDESKIYFAYGSYDVLPLEVEMGTGSYQDLNGETHNVDTYRFKSALTPSDEANRYYKTSGKYLSYGHAYKEDGHDTWAHGDISFRAANNEYSNWRVTIDNEGDAHIQYLTEQYPTEIRYLSGTARAHFGYYQSYYAVQLYRLIDTSKAADIMEISSQDATSVTEGEKVNLSGLELRITIDGVTFNTIYDNEPQFYDIPNAVYNGEYPNVQHGAVFYKVFGINYRALVDIYPIITPITTYHPVTSQLNDYRASYVLAAQIDDYKYITMRTTIESMHDKTNHEYYDTVEYYTVNMHTHIEDEYPVLDDYDINSHDIGDNIDADKYEYTIRRKTVNSVSYMFLFANDDSSKVLSNNNGLLDFVNFNSVNTANAALTIDNDSNLYLGGNRIVYDCDRELIAFYNQNHDCVRLQLLKKDIDVSEEVLTFVESFDSYTHDICDYDGIYTQPITEQEWSTQAAVFESLSADTQGYLANLTYNHNAETSGSAKDIIDRYDYIVNKYSQPDFIHRDELAQTLQPSSPIIISNNVIENVTSAIVAIIVASSTLLVAMLLYFKKRKSN